MTEDVQNVELRDLERELNAAKGETCCCCCPMRLGLRIVAYTTFIGAIMSVLSCYQLFATLGSDALVRSLFANTSSTPDLIMFVVLMCRFVQFFGSVLTMQWMYDDTKAYRYNLKQGLLIYLTCQTVCMVIYMLLFFAWAAASKVPIGFAFPILTWEAFAYEILYFYFWSVARRYSDLCDIEEQKGGKMEMQ